MNWASTSTTCLVLHGDTAIVQYGIGTFGSRGTAVGGTALYFALQDMKEKIKKFGAMLLESEDVDVRQRHVHRTKTGKDSHACQTSPGAAYRAMKLPPDTEPGLVATHFWEPPNFTFPFGAHIVVTRSGPRNRRDRDQTLRRGGRYAATLSIR